MNAEDGIFHTMSTVTVLAMKFYVLASMTMTTDILNCCFWSGKATVLVLSIKAALAFHRGMPEVPDITRYKGPFLT
jgi:hypothetical protein